MRERRVPERAKTAPSKRATATSGEPATDGRSRWLWFNAPMNDQDRRPPAHPRARRRRGAQCHRPGRRPGVDHAHPGRALGVVPGALYHHVRNKEQLQDLVLDGVLAQVNGHLDPSQPWPNRSSCSPIRCGRCWRTIPGLPGSSRPATRSGRTPPALAEAFLAPLQAAGFGDREAGLAFFLLVDYTTGFAVSSPPIAVNEQRVRDAAIRTQLHEFFRSLPADRFPALVALGEYVWLENRDERFTAGLDVLVDGLEHARRSPHRPALGGRPTTTTIRLREEARQAVGNNTLGGEPDEHRRSLWVLQPGAAAGAAGPAQRRLPVPVLRLRLRARLRDRCPGVSTRVMAAQQALVTALAELASMTGDQLRLDQATVVDPVANALPQAKQPALARQRRAHW
jgi:AcrR family transcriptional regulator